VTIIRRLLTCAQLLPIAVLATCGGDHSEAAPDKPEKTGHVLVGPVRMYYQVYGHGKPFVLLHGGSMTIEESFAHQIPYFARTLW
jgi:hypothetical protein